MIDEGLLRPCDRGTDLTQLNAGLAAVVLIDQKDALLARCADRQEALAAAARALTAKP